MTTKVTAGVIAANAVNSAQIISGSIDTAHIASGQVTTAKIADSNVTTAKIADSNITTAKINDDAVTSAKLDTNIDIAGTFDVTGATTLDSTLSVSGNATFDTTTLVVDATNDRVGIGASSPSSILDINASAPIITIESGDTQDSKILFVEGGTNAVSLFYEGSAGAGTANNFHIRSELSGSETNLVTVGLDGSVGIGTDSPSSTKKLHVYSGNSGGSDYGVPGLAIENDTNVSLQFMGGASHQLGITFSDPGTTEAGYIYYNTGTNDLEVKVEDDVVFKSGSTETVRIDSEGNLGILTGNQGVQYQRLHVGGSGASIYLGNNSADTNFIHTGGCLALTADTDVYITADSNDTSSTTPPAGVIVFGGGSSTDTDSNLDFTEAEFGNNGAARVEYGRFHSNGFFGLNTTPGVELDLKRKTNAYPFRIGSETGEGRAMVFADVASTPTKYNWLVGAQYNVDNSFEITPSTAVGGYTFSTPGILVKQDGKVGIGETVPLAKLHVKEGDSGQGTINSNFDQLCLEDDQHAGMSIFSGSSSDGAIYFGDSGSNDIGQIKYKHNGDVMAFTTAGAEQLTLYQTQNGGITEGYLKLASIDSATFIINADTDNSEEDGVPTLDFKMDGSVTRFKMGVAADNNPYISTQSDIALPLIIKTGTSGQNRVYINDTGMQICDGTAGAPDHMLQLKKDGAPVDDRTFISIVNGSGAAGTDIGSPESHIDFEFFDANTNEYPQARITAGTGTNPGVDANTQNLEGQGYIALATNDGSGTSGEVDPTNRLIVDSNGRVLINQTSSNLTFGKLQVSAGGETAGHGGIVGFFDTDASVGSSNLIQLLSFSGDTDSTGGQFIRFRDNNSVMGSVSAASGTTVAYNTSSDERMKENIVNASSQLNTVKSIQIREFDWVNNGHHEVGVIAQELNEIIPNVVQEGGEDATEEPWGVDYGKLTPYLIKAVQELSAKLEAAEARIEALENGN